MFPIENTKKKKNNNNNKIPLSTQEFLYIHIHIYSNIHISCERCTGLSFDDCSLERQFNPLIKEL